MVEVYLSLFSLRENQLAYHYTSTTTITTTEDAGQCIPTNVLWMQGPVDVFPNFKSVAHISPSNHS